MRMFTLAGLAAAGVTVVLNYIALWPLVSGHRDALILLIAGSVGLGMSIVFVCLDVSKQASAPKDDRR